MPNQPTPLHSPRAGCSLCTIITNSQPPPTLQPPAGPSGSQYPASPILPDSQWVSLPLNTPTPISTGTFLTSSDSPTTPSPLNSNTTNSKTLEDVRAIVYRDEEVTVWTARREKGEALASGGRHLVVAFNAHVESIYELGRQDVPLLLRTMRIASELLDKVSNSTTERKQMGFVVGAVRDPSHPYAHIHLHAVVGKWDLASFYRKTVVFNFIGWYDLEDLIAEIREGSSNNRVKSGYESGRSDLVTSTPTITADANDTRIPAVSNEDQQKFPTMDSGISPTRKQKDKGKQRESQQPRPTVNTEPQVDPKEQAVKDIDLLIERVKLDQAASEVEYRAARGDRGGKEPMV